MRARLAAAVVALLAPAAAALVSCSSPKAAPPAETAPRTEPDRVEVQHCLVSFEDRGAKATRSQSEAEALAREIFERARRGEDFDALVKAHTDDQHPGIYAMTNVDVTPDRALPEYPRMGMVPSFGDVSFALEPGEVGLAEFDVNKSPYGWHIIRRLR